MVNERKAVTTKAENPIRCNLTVFTFTTSYPDSLTQFFIILNAINKKTTVVNHKVSYIN